MKLDNDRLAEFITHLEKGHGIAQGAIPIVLELARSELARRSEPSPRGAFTKLFEKLKDLEPDGRVTMSCWVKDFIPFDQAHLPGVDAWEARVDGIAHANGRSGEEALRRLVDVIERQHGIKGSAPDFARRTSR